MTLFVSILNNSKKTQTEVNHNDNNNVPYNLEDLRWTQFLDGKYLDSTSSMANTNRHLGPVPQLTVNS